MKTIIEVTKAEKIMIIAALRFMAADSAVDLAQPIEDAIILNGLADKLGNADSADDGPEVAILSVDQDAVDYDAMGIFPQEAADRLGRVIEPEYDFAAQRRRYLANS